MNSAKVIAQAVFYTEPEIWKPLSMWKGRFLFHLSLSNDRVTAINNPANRKCCSTGGRDVPLGIQVEEKCPLPEEFLVRLGVHELLSGGK